MNKKIANMLSIFVMTGTFLFNHAFCQELHQGIAIMEECTDRNSLPTQEQLDVFAHLPEEQQTSAFLMYVDRLDNEQRVAFMNLPVVTNYLEKDVLDVVLRSVLDQSMGPIILKKGSPKLKELYFYKIYVPLRWDDDRHENRKKWFRAVGFYDPSEPVQATGPLFATSDEKVLGKLDRLRRHPNIAALIPLIAEYVAEEYRQDRIVLFHGHASEWIALRALYRALDEFKHERKLPDTFVHLRFKAHSSLSEKEIEDRTPYWRRHSYENQLIFTTLHFADGCAGNNTLVDYVLESFDQTARYGIKIHSLTREMFQDLNLSTEYGKLQNSTIFQELERLCAAAVREQGGYGQLLVISMPKECARRLSYLADDNGLKKDIFINGVATSDVVTIAEHFAVSPFDKQFALLLSEEIINPEAAARAGVKIVAFDPAASWRTEQYLKFEAKLHEMINLLQEMGKAE